jgi:hypothetical protein
MNGWRRPAASLTAAALATLALATFGAVAAAGPAGAAAQPVGDCTTTSGVIVAVDFGHWGGPVLRSCGTTPTTAYDLLNQGGWRTTGDEHDGPGFICRIGYAGYHGGTQYPTPSQDACVLTPPASAYWAFWYANPGQNAWTYSSEGAMSTDPVPGSVELWVFGGTNIGGTSGSAVPAVSPGGLRAENKGPAGTVHGRVSAPPATAPARNSPPAGAGATPAPSRTGAAGATAASVRPTILVAPPTTASAPAGHGSATPAIIALVIVLVLAAVGITAVLRRPRGER